MNQLDETDFEILSLLVEDGRRPFSQIGEKVGLSGPAVSTRVSRLQEVGIIRQFTVDVDHNRISGGVHLLVEVDVPAGDADKLRSRLGETDAVEHVFVTATGELHFTARVEAQSIRTWLASILTEECEYTVTLIDGHDWTPSVDGSAFALSCAECGNTVDSQGSTTRIDGDIYHFCCGSCESRFTDRYDELSAHG